MYPVSDVELVARLILAAVLGFLIGLEREFRGQAAGERTHALVALGAAAFALLSGWAFPGADTARVAAGVVTGIGFLGAGMILKREGERIEGLTTAAGLWAVGSIGLAIGAGMYLLGTVTAALVGLILMAESILRLDERLERRRGRGEGKGPPG
ncbi:MAG TPA: MgtC/SapB family protein [Anaerolineae bacterium]|jgi:putative Mg2+ transporter-C (MgtC) family protein|nr:MgtC/SapB family protein [Anaerolineae bacterium]